MLLHLPIPNPVVSNIRQSVMYEEAVNTVGKVRQGKVRLSLCRDRIPGTRDSTKA